MQFKELGREELLKARTTVPPVWSTVVRSAGAYTGEVICPRYDGENFSEIRWRAPRFPEQIWHLRLCRRQFYREPQRIPPQDPRNNE